MKYLFSVLILAALTFTVALGCKKDKKSSDKGTCTDGIKNQNETNIDCGGVCSACQSCSDGIQNQGETGIDCGGPCGKCPIVYALNGFYGPNIIWFGAPALFNIRGTVFPNPDTTHYYSIAAKMPANTALKVRITCLSSSNSRPWFYDVSSVGTWKVNSPADNIQEFYNTDQGNPDLKILFTNNGNARIEVFENNADTAAHTKVIYWNL